MKKVFALLIAGAAFSGVAAYMASAHPRAEAAAR